MIQFAAKTMNIFQMMVMHRAFRMDLSNQFICFLQHLIFTTNITIVVIVIIIIIAIIILDRIMPNKRVFYLFGQRFPFLQFILPHTFQNLQLIHRQILRHSFFRVLLLVRTLLLNTLQYFKLVQRKFFGHT